MLGRDYSDAKSESQVEADLKMGKAIHSTIWGTAPNISRMTRKACKNLQGWREGIRSTSACSTTTLSVPVTTPCLMLWLCLLSAALGTAPCGQNLLPTGKPSSHNRPGREKTVLEKNGISAGKEFYQRPGPLYLQPRVLCLRVCPEGRPGRPQWLAL